MDKLKLIIFVVVITSLILVFKFRSSEFPIKSQAASSVTLYVNNISEDIYNEEFGIYTNPYGSGSRWIGTGYDRGGSFLGIRFTGASVLAGASITSAEVRVRSEKAQWIGMGFNVYGEQSSSSSKFDTSNPVYNRLNTDATTCYFDDVPWNDAQEYAFDVTPIVQELVDCCSGNYMTIIFEGSESQYSRKEIETTSTTQTKLVVNYENP